MLLWHSVHASIFYRLYIKRFAALFTLKNVIAFYFVFQNSQITPLLSCCIFVISVCGYLYNQSKTILIHISTCGNVKMNCEWLNSFLIKEYSNMKSQHPLCPLGVAGAFSSKAPTEHSHLWRQHSSHHIFMPSRSSCSQNSCLWQIGGIPRVWVG